MYSPSLAKKICEKKFKVFGRGSEVRHGAVVIGCSNIELGESVILRPYTYLVAGICGIVIEDKVLIASGVQMHTSNHRYTDINVPIFDQGFEEEKKIHIKKGAWIGANAVILPGVTIGENAVIAAGSIVNKDVPANTLVAGVPGKVKKIIT